MIRVPSRMPRPLCALARSTVRTALRTAARTALRAAALLLVVAAAAPLHAQDAPARAQRPGLRPDHTPRIAAHPRITIERNDPGAAGWIDSTTLAAELARAEAAETPVAVADWYTPQTEMLRITLRESGVYRITHADLVAAGVDPAGIDPRRLQLWNRGVEQPLLVTGEDDGRFDATDTIIFHAERLAGDDTWFHPHTDDNVYFLGTDATAPRRYASRTADPTGAPALTTRHLRLHIERDSVYHLGDHQYVDMTETEQVTGEGWIWTYLFKKDSLAHVFTLDAAPAGEASLTVRLRSASIDPSRARVELNGVLVDSIDLATYQTVVRTLPVAQDLLRAGTNRLVIRNSGVVECPPTNPLCSLERLYVDWADLDMPASLTAANGELLIPHDTIAAPRTADVTLDGFTTADVLVLNPVAGTRASGVVTTGAPGAWSLALSIATDSTCIAVERAALRTPTGMTRVRMPRPDAADADYIIVTHAAFRAPAARLAAYRAQHDGFRTAVAEVDDIYIAFNDGIKHPVAIRRFMLDAWQRSTNRPRFLTIVGDASWDPKMLQAGSTRTDYVPTYGNPVSDNYYVAFAASRYDVWPEIAHGRIPAETAADADAVIDKIIAYEALPPQPWDNRILFAIGGESLAEQQRYLVPPVAGLTTSHVDPYCLRGDRVLKSTFDQGVTYDDLDTLVARMNAGTSWFYFIGHGGSRIIDVGIERPEIFSLENRYPVFITMSCNTAHFAEPYETGLNERFVMAPRNGSIVSLGTSGLGEIGHDYVLSQGMMDAMLQRNVRSYGEMMLHARRRLLDSGTIGSLYVRNTVNQYILLGDPATRIPLAEGPELLVQSADMVTTPAILTEREAALVHTRLRNAGRCLVDSVDVRFTVSAQGREVHRQQRRIPPFRHTVDLDWAWDFADLDGEVTIEIEIDPEARLAAEYRANNRAGIVRTVLPRGITQIFPLADAMLDLARTPVISFTVANPSEMPDPGVDAVVDVEIADDPDMRTALRTVSTPAGDVYTTLAYTHARQQPATLWWRARLRSVLGTEPWSPVRALTLGASDATGERWSLVHAGQRRTLALRNLRDDGTALTLGERPLVIDVASGGFNNYTFKSSLIRLDGADVSPNRRGFNLAVIDAALGTLVDTVNFDTYWTADEARRMAAYLRTVPDDAIIAAAVLDDANGYFNPDSPVRSNIVPELRAELARFGARLVDSIGFRDSWAFIGTRSDPARAREAHLAFGAVFFADTVTVRALEGEVAGARVGPADTWSTIWWDGTEGAASSTLRLRAWLPAAEADSLIFESAPVAPGVRVSLAGIDAAMARRLRIGAVLSDPGGTGSPRLAALHAEFGSSFPELGVTSRSVVLEADSVLEGESVVVRSTVHNAGRSAARGVTVSLTLPPEAGGYAASQTIDDLTPGATTDLDWTVPTAGVRGVVPVTVNINPGRVQTEYYHGNDIYARRFRSVRDAARPVLDVRFDGQEVVANDYVSPTPVITVSLRDASPLPVTDTVAVQMFLDGRRVWLVGNPEVQLLQGGSGEEKVHVRFTPVLRPGARVLAVSARDASGNQADTIPWQVRVLVSTETKADNVYPFPNPAPGQADFTFRLLGAELPDRAVLRIYTVAGRRVYERELASDALRIGFNRIPWDGRDSDGDRLANGTYFYRLTFERPSGSEQHTGRLSVLR